MLGKEMHMISEVGVMDFVAYENGDMDEYEVIDFFQRLVDTGMINHLQGHYGRTAQSLIDSGDIFG